MGRRTRRTRSSDHAPFVIALIWVAIMLLLLAAGIWFFLTYIGPMLL